MSPILGIYASQITGKLSTLTGSYDSIQTTTVGSGGTASVTFSSIPSTYTHLQLRYMGKSTDTSGNWAAVQIRLNSDTGNNYATHALYGDGASAAAAASTSYSGHLFYSGRSTLQVGAAIIDILDYTNTNKNTTIRTLAGVDNNGSGIVDLASGLWMNTAAITSITFNSFGGSPLFSEYSSFALYGIKGN
jgi:hypothetical protein